MTTREKRAVAKWRDSERWQGRRVFGADRYRSLRHFLSVSADELAHSHEDMSPVHVRMVIEERAGNWRGSNPPRNKVCGFIESFVISLLVKLIVEWILARREARAQ